MTVPLNEEEAAVEITLDCEAEIAFGVPPGTALGPQYFVLDEDALLVGTSKPVQIVALLTVDKFDRPTSCEISQVSALETDPGHALWRGMRTPMSDETRAAINRMASNLIMSDETRSAINRMASDLIMSDETRAAINRMASNSIMSDETRAAINRMASNLTMSDETRAAINRMANIAKYRRSGGGADGPQQPGSERDSGSSGAPDIADKGGENLAGGDDETRRN